MKKIFVSGTYDLLHAGHVQFFKEAKALGDYLIVSFCSNENLIKYKGRPSCMPDDNKQVLLESIKYIDKVTKGNEDGIWDFVPSFLEEKPDVLAVTTDDTHAEEKKIFCQEHDVEFVVLPKTHMEGITQTTSFTIIKNILNMGITIT